MAHWPMIFDAPISIWKRKILLHIRSTAYREITMNLQIMIFMKNLIWKSILRLNQLIKRNSWSTSISVTILVLKKSELWKHLEFVHSKDKSHNYSICVFNFSGINILKRHANYFHEDKMSQNMLKLWLWFFWKSQIEKAC